MLLRMKKQHMHIRNIKVSLKRKTDAYFFQNWAVMDGKKLGTLAFFVSQPSPVHG